LGNGTFTTTAHPIGWNSSGVDLSDLDGDGDLDLALASFGSSMIIVLANDGAGTFTVAGSFAAGGGTVAAGDFDGDGDGDLVSAGTTSAVLLLRSALLSGIPFCAGDGSATACPCGNASPVGEASGCLNSLALGGKLRGSGSASLDDDHLRLVGSGMPDSSALYFQGTTQFGGGAGAVFGDGLRCVGGTVVRLATVSNAGNGSSIPGPGGMPLSVRGFLTTPGVVHYQVWYRNAASFCTASTFNLTNGLSVVWRP
jgi:hypothetical protein